MEAKFIAAAVPVFFLLIAIELLLARRAREPPYLFEDSIANLSCGVGQQLLEPFIRALPVFLYAAAYEHLRLFTISPRSVAGWIALLFLVDFCYYLFHRASHRVNFIWAGHAIHHQSEEYNLSVALRQSWFVGIVSGLFYLPLAVLGFPPLMYGIMVTLNTLYQFWIHTRLVDRLGPLEWVLNTPSHHRVHHAIDPRYIDKNYAGIFIIWDRLLRTFRAEDAEPVYGTVKPLRSWNPLWANLEPIWHLIDMSRRTRRLRDKVLVWFMPPEWRPADLGGPVTPPETSRAAQVRYAQAASGAMRAYVSVQFALVVLAATAYLYYQGSVSPALLCATAAALLLSMTSLGGLLEARRWARPLEALRLAALVPLALWAAGVL